MNDIIFEIINLIVMIAALVVARYIVPWVKEKIGTEKLNTVAEWAKKAVLYAEQVMTAATGEEKKEAVTAIIKEIVESANISITDEQIDILIESAVKQMNMDSALFEVEIEEEIEEEPEETEETEETEEPAEEPADGQEPEGTAENVAVVGETTVGEASKEVVG